MKESQFQSDKKQKKTWDKLFPDDKHEPLSERICDYIDGVTLGHDQAMIAEIRALEEGLRKIEHESHYQGLLTDINYGRSGALNRIHAIAHNLTGGEDD